MKKTLTFLAALLTVLSTQAAFSADVIWSVGTPNASHAEFSGSGDLKKAAEIYSSPTPLSFNVGAKLDPAKDFPWILPGPADIWAETKSHAVRLNFDMPEKSDTTVYLLEIRAIGQNPGPPTIEVDLNGAKRTAATKPGVTKEQIFTTSEGAQWMTYRFLFAGESLNKAGNALTITTTAGSWLVFDSLRLSVADARVEAFTFSPPLRGVFRGPNDTPVRRVPIEFTRGYLTRPATLKLVELGGKTPPVEVAISPFSETAAGFIDVPVAADAISQELTFSATLIQSGAAAAAKPVSAELTLPPEKKWEVYIIHQTHLDIGYTHTQADVLARQVQALRDALKYIEHSKDYPEDAKFRFHPEGLWAVDAFMKEATPEEKTAFIAAAKARDIHLDGMYAHAMTGMFNDEELFELFAPAVRFCRENDIPLDSAIHSDVPGNTWGTVTVLGQNGIKYFNMAPNPGHRTGRVYDWAERPFWWVSPSGDEKVLCWIHNTSYNRFHFQPVDHRITEAQLYAILDGHRMVRRGVGYRYEDLAVLRYCVEIDNGRPNPVLSDVVKEWNEKYIYPRLVISRNSDVMRLLEERYGDQLPVVSGDLTPFWEDGAASTSEATAINRRASERIIQAGVLGAMFAPKKYPVGDFDAAWIDLIMYDEHTWGAHNSISAPDHAFAVSQDAFKQEYARRGAREVDALIGESAGAVAGEMVLVDTLSYQRGGVCFIGKAPAAPGNIGVKVFETADGRHVPVQFVEDLDGKTVSAYADFSFAGPAPVVTPMGATVLKPSATKISLKTALNVDLATGEMANGKIRLVIDKNSGTISSLKVTGTDHEFVSPGADGNRGLDDYLYIIGRDANQNRARDEKPVKLTLLAAGPLVASVLVEAEPGATPDAESFQRRVTIFAGSNAVRIENLVDKKKERRPESVFFGFPFNVPGGKWHVDTPWASVEVEKDQLQGANRNYYCVQRYCTLAGKDCGVDWVSVDSHLAQFTPLLLAGATGDHFWRKNFADGDPDGTIYAWVCNNHWETNYKADQHGPLTFEYWIRPYAGGAWDNAESQRFARQVHQPLLRFEAGEKVTARPSLLTLSNSKNVVVASARPARDGSGALIVRLFNPTPETQATTITPALPYKTIRSSDTMEAKGETIPAEISLRPWETRVLRVEE